MRLLENHVSCHKVSKYSCQENGGVNSCEDEVFNRQLKFIVRGGPEGEGFDERFVCIEGWVGARVGLGLSR